MWILSRDCKNIIFWLIFINLCWSVILEGMFSLVVFIIDFLGVLYWFGFDGSLWLKFFLLNFLFKYFLFFDVDFFKDYFVVCYRGFLCINVGKVFDFEKIIVCNFFK